MVWRCSYWDWHRKFTIRSRKPAVSPARLVTVSVVSFFRVFRKVFSFDLFYSSTYNTWYPFGIFKDLDVLKPFYHAFIRADMEIPDFDTFTGKVYK